MVIRALLVGCVVVVCASIAAGDEITFRNGDRISGTIIDATGGKLKIKTPLAGEISVELKDVKTFSTDEPIVIELPDGSRVKRRIDAGADGTVVTEGPAPLAGTVIPLADIQRVNPPEATWTGALVLSGLVTSGNSQTQSLSVAADAARRTDRDRISGAAGYLFSRQKDNTTGVKSTTADNWFLSLKYDYYFTKKFYGFGQFRVERDRIAELDLRLTPNVGVGYQWVERPDMNLATEIGVAWVYESYTTGGTSDHVAARAAYHIDKRFNESVTVFHNLEYLPSLESISDFNVTADAGLRASLSRNMFSEFKVTWSYDATPAPTALKNDLSFLVGVGWRI